MHCTAGSPQNPSMYGMMNRQTEQEQNPVCLSYALQEGGRTTDRLSNFIAVREDSCYYVDKTRFIEEVEVHSGPAYAGWVPPSGWFPSFPHGASSFRRALSSSPRWCGARDRSGCPPSLWAVPRGQTWRHSPSGLSGSWPSGRTC